MDFIKYLIAAINAEKNAYSLPLFLNPPVISKEHDKEISGYDMTGINKWNPSQKTTLVKILWYNSLWKTCRILLPQIHYQHTWEFGYATEKKYMRKFIDILQTSPGWKPLAYYYVIEILRKCGSDIDTAKYIFDKSDINTIKRLHEYNIYPRACILYLTDILQCE